MEQAEAQRVAEAGVGRMLDADAASRKVGITVAEVRPGHAVARMRVTGDMINGHGNSHGGFVFLVADTAFAAACNTYGKVTVARSVDIVFVASAREGDELVATADERSRTGRNGIYDVTVRRGDEVIAEFRGQSRELERPLV
jgi:acyl-CoA thioesterase